MVKKLDNSNNKSATFNESLESNHNIAKTQEEIQKQEQQQQEQQFEQQKHQLNEGNQLYQNLYYEIIKKTYVNNLLTDTKRYANNSNNNNNNGSYIDNINNKQYNFGIDETSTIVEPIESESDKYTYKNKFRSTNFVQYATNTTTPLTQETLTAPNIPTVAPGLKTIETNYQHKVTSLNSSSEFDHFQLQNAYRSNSSLSASSTAAASASASASSSSSSEINHSPTAATSQNFHELLCQTCSNKFPTELQPEDEERLERIFKKLDRNGDGKIDVYDLSEALHEFGFSRVYAEKFMEHSDKNRSGNLGFAEFLQYVREHEKHLCLQFSHIDKNQDGKVDLEELVSAFKDLGLEVDREEAKKLLARMDKDGSLNISFHEWRDFLLMAPSTDIHDLIKFWRHSTYLDIGEDMNVPDDFTQNEMQTGMWWRHLAAGGIAGAVSRTCTAPLDRVKVYLQVQTRKMGISECMKYMLNEGGPISMWRGNGINVVKIAPESAIKFAAYEQMKGLIRGNENRSMSISERFVAGAAAGGISQTIIYPMEVLKTRLALRRTGQYKGIFDAASKIYHKEGLRSFYRGYVPNIIGILPYAGIDLAVYETLKRKYIASHAGNEQPSFLVLLACGSMSSALGQLCSYPLALVRTRLQAQAALETTQIRRIQIPMKSAEVTSEDTMVGLFRKIIHSEGLAGLYRGITPNFLKVLPAVSISYVVYEYSSRALGIKMS